MEQAFIEINQISSDIHAANELKGFWEDRTKIPELMRKAEDVEFLGAKVFSDSQISFVEKTILSQQLMLVCSEISEAEEALRKDRHADLSAFDTAIDAGIPFNQAFTTYVKDTFEDEIADAIIRLLDSAGGHGMDIGRHIQLKLQYNATRPHKHGKSH